MVVNGEEHICRDSKCKWTAVPKEKISVFVTGTLDGGCSAKYEEATGKTCCYARIKYDKRCESNNNSDTCLKISVNETKIIVNETKNEESEGCLLTIDNQGNISNLTVHVEFPLRPDLNKIITLLPPRYRRYYTALLILSFFGFLGTILIYIVWFKPNFQTQAAKKECAQIFSIPFLVWVIIFVFFLSELL